MDDHAVIAGSVTIRPYHTSDRDALRRISCATAFLGLPLSLFVDDDVIVADILTRYYTDFEPQSCFVAVAGNTVVGYIIGSVNAKKARQIFMRQIMMPALWRAVRKGIFLKENALRFLRHLMVSVIKGEFRDPDFSHLYPATLHINIDKNFHRHRIGSKLIARYLEYLQNDHITGVHLGTISSSAKEFFIKNGFSLLYSGRRSYLCYITKDIANYYILGKKLSEQANV